MAVELFNRTFNNWFMQIASAVGVSDTSIVVQNNGAENAVGSAGDINAPEEGFIENPQTPGIPFKADVKSEIILVTGIIVDTPSAGQTTLTVTREQDGTSAVTATTADYVQQRAYASQLNEIGVSVNALLNYIRLQAGEDSGVLQSGSTGDDLQVKSRFGTTVEIKVLPGAVLVNGQVATNVDTPLSGILTTPSVNPRIDNVLIDRFGRLSVGVGVENASPSAPSYVSTTHYKLAEIYNRVGQTSIKDADDATNGYITDARSFI